MKQPGVSQEIHDVRCAVRDVLGPANHTRSIVEPRTPAFASEEQNRDRFARVASWLSGWSPTAFRPSNEDLLNAESLISETEPEPNTMAFMWLEQLRAELEAA
ncbi:MAG: hypothetical protein AAGE52_01570 [Myxococcota bacterium]